MISASVRWRDRAKACIRALPLARIPAHGVIGRWGTCVSLLMIGAGSGADLPTPAHVGFHHCALVYERASRTSEDLLPYVADLRESRSRAWLFDAFLFLHFTALSGVRTDDGATTRPDWEHQLDTWFAPGRDLHALDQAVEIASRSLGPPKRPRQIILTMPYPNPSVRSFGILPDGSSPDLSSLSGVRKAAEWYVGEARRRFESAGFRHLRLWGIYWMREEMPANDEPRVATVSEVVHKAGLRLAWIPWWRASGFERWREVGFDVAFLQPNYAFHSWTHGGAVRRNRLAAAADLARRHGLGIEIEAGSVLESEADRSAFLHYLADGSPKRLGYGRSAMAYFLSTDTVERLATSRSPAAVALYAALADFVRGREVRDPDPPLRFRRTSRGWEAPIVPERHVSRLDVFLDGDAAGAWRGALEITVKSASSSTWEPGGWAIRSGRDETSGLRQVITVPIGRRVREICVRSHGSEPFPMASARIAVESFETESPRTHVALGRRYALSDPPHGVYDDRGGKLTDGVEPTAGFGEGKSVGWTSPMVAVSFDLQRPRRVSRVEVSCQGGSYGAVNWPAEAALLLSQSKTPPALAHAGPMPAGLRWISGDPPRVVRRRSAQDLDGVISFMVPEAEPARYVTLAFRPSGWLMLTEARIFADGADISRDPGVTYTLRPLPTPTPETAANYADDGVRLTDGVIATTLNRALVTGWQDRDVRTLEVELDGATPVSSVTVWTLAGGLHGIYAPSGVTVAGYDGKEWRSLGAANASPVTEDGRECRPLAYRLECRPPAAVTALRIIVTRGRGWAMLSEVEVR